MSKILVSGIKPTGRLHLGNYFGAIKQFVELVKDYESYVFIADYHALTTVKDKDALRKDTFDIACAYLACGLDPEKVTLFKQSDVPEHAELSVIFNNVVTMPYLMRAHAFKDSETKNKEVNVGLFTYPVLMAADILMYQADVVPVGSDQKQHIEYARDIAGYFNRTWGEYFKLPKEMINDATSTVPGTDGQKMSKSYGNVIPLFGSDDEIRKAVMGVVTDSKAPEEKKNPDENNVYKIHKLFLTPEQDTEVRQKYEAGGLSYKEAKDLLYEAILAFIAPQRAKYDHYQANPDEVYKILEEGGTKARARAQEAMRDVREKVGLTK